jgi:hypothetical protein
MTIGAAAALIKAKEAGCFRSLWAVISRGETRPLLEVWWRHNAPIPPPGVMCDVRCDRPLWQCKREENWQTILPLIRSHPEVGHQGDQKRTTGDGPWLMSLLLLFCST